jgi:hypothetical protein
VAFALYRSGERFGPVVNLTFDERDASPTTPPHEGSRLLQLISEFLVWKAVAPTTLPVLAERLAPLCAVLREAVTERLADQQSEVAKAARELRDALFASRSDHEVADAFAQVCTYAMLLARSQGAEHLDSATIEHTLRHGHPVLGRAVRLLLDDETEEELGWALETVRSLIEAVDFERLRPEQLQLLSVSHEADTWLYFYEEFLASYDPQLRDQFGVYYTPPAVISAQVALLDELLREKLGKSDGLAADEVTLLDPAVGTGSYLLRVIEVAADHVESTRGSGAVAARMSDLARNMSAFEVLVGPYAVAHLRISELLTELGAQLPSDGLGVYLADTLSSPYREPLSLGRLLEPLVEEQKRAQRVKGDERILVCLGNPPYERLSAEAEDGTRRLGGARRGWGRRSDLLDLSRSCSFAHDVQPHREPLQPLRVLLALGALEGF